MIIEVLRDSLKTYSKRLLSSDTTGKFIIPVIKVDDIKYLLSILHAVQLVLRHRKSGQYFRESFAKISALNIESIQRDKILPKVLPKL